MLKKKQKEVKKNEYNSNFDNAYNMRYSFRNSNFRKGEKII